MKEEKIYQIAAVVKTSLVPSAPGTRLWSKLAWITLSGFMCGLYIRSLHPSSMRKCRHDTTGGTQAEAQKVI